MILNKLGVRGKLNMLLMLPLAAVVLVAVPFVTVQIDNARSAITTADAARNARQLGALVWELQRERLLTAGYLASSSSVDRVALQAQQQTVADTVHGVLDSLGPGISDELSSALIRVGSLRDLQQAALGRGAALDSVARAYHAVIGAIIDALRLVPQRISDAEGTRQLTVLEALLRANEESAARGAGLIVAAKNPQTGTEILNDATAHSQMFTEQFVEQADLDQSTLVVLVDQGEAARQVDNLAERLPKNSEAPIREVEAFVSEAVAAADSQARLRRLVQDRLTQQIADAAADRSDRARSVAWMVGVGTAVLFMLVTALTMLVSRSIANPLQRLTRAATAVSDLANAELVRVADVENVDEKPPALAAIDVSGGDEIGELAIAFNRVQATAALLVERQMITRRSVSLMFTNVAQRTRNLVNRQLAVVDELERNEENARLLGRLYELDHLSTRLRRNAENLLVIAGSHEEARIRVPTPLATVLRAAITEIEDYQRVRFGTAADITLAPLAASDLVLVFAELLENAAVFSPPDSTVDVNADRPVVNGPCEVRIVDHGMGMAEHRLAEENRRLVERERLDIAPTAVLGLFVVGRLARRHGLAVQLEPTPGRGVTAVVTIPANLFSASLDRERVVPAVPIRAASVARAAIATPPSAQIPPSTNTDGFSWFSSTRSNRTVPPQGELVAGPTAAGASAHAAPPVQAATPAGNGAASSGVSRRVPGAQLPASASRKTSDTQRARDPDKSRELMDGYQSAVARATVHPSTPAQPGHPGYASPPAPVAPPPAPVPDAASARAAGTASVTPPTAVSQPGAPGSRALARRVPGANLDPGLRAAADGGRRAAPAGRHTRDPAADRAAFDGYTHGFARGRAEQPGQDHDPTRGNP
jgi:signal transduction histidine kinase